MYIFMYRGGIKLHANKFFLFARMLRYSLKTNKKKGTQDVHEQCKNGGWQGISQADRTLQHIMHKITTRAGQKCTANGGDGGGT